jgi:hypothetical protein
VFIRGVYICWGPPVQVPVLDGDRVWPVCTQRCVQRSYLSALVTLSCCTQDTGHGSEWHRSWYGVHAVQCCTVQGSAVLCGVAW